MCKMQSTVSLNSFTVFALLYTYLFPVTLELRENLLQISLLVQFPGSEATFSECGSQNVFHHRLPRTFLSGRTYAYSSSSMPLAAAVILSNVSSEKSRFFYGYNYNCILPACQANFKISQLHRSDSVFSIFFIPHSLRIPPYQ